MNNLFNKSILDNIAKVLDIQKLKELLDLLVILANKIFILFEHFGLLIWKIFSSIFGTLLQFTIDLVKLILSYLS
ncbi:MAG: hypothetical protein AAB396_00590 [Patescibacteria group bacterium]